ncbi:hypothetical protein CISIN_1g035326mg [Citrus sinensis]|uniref:Uncharacterized protein n=1 Tax=Citrus sinensis TaxID=2711 RepID=A0A067EXJ3_CITSI|nr:hypothetical protein CISIN_1g035326mg [Citrus sinensis]
MINIRTSTRFKSKSFTGFRCFLIPSNFLHSIAHEPITGLLQKQPIYIRLPLRLIPSKITEIFPLEPG